MTQLLQVFYSDTGGGGLGGGIGAGINVDAEPVAVEEAITAEGAQQVESGFGFSMPGLSVSYFRMIVQ